MTSRILVGTAGWSVPLNAKSGFPSEGTHLRRYSGRLDSVEINSSFYRDHKPETYLKWAGETPDGFRFSVKLSRYFTQEMRLLETGTRLTEVLAGISGLGEKWEVLLVQLPPSLGFDLPVARNFFSAVRSRYEGGLALEPRHVSWAAQPAIELLREFKIGKVIADPERCPLPDPQYLGSESLLYLRLHGSPEIYKSRYSPELLAEAGRVLREASQRSIPAWCIFDNTTFGHATGNALELASSLRLTSRERQEAA